MYHTKLKSMRIIDLTETIEAGMKVYEGDPEVKIKQVQSIKKHGWKLNLLTFGSHTGTHVDAPAHMHEGATTLDQLPLEKFIGEAQVVTLESEFQKNIGLVFRSGEVGVDFFEKIFLANSPFVVVGNKATLSVDMERKLLERDILTFTDLINLEELPDDRSFGFYGIPLKIKASDGSPIRAFAIV
jgi:arylformamidase